MPALKKCPFCGDDAYIWNVSRHQYRVSCKSDCAAMPARPDCWFTSDDTAAEAWNTRADAKVENGSSHNNTRPKLPTIDEFREWADDNEDYCLEDILDYFTQQFRGYQVK